MSNVSRFAWIKRRMIEVKENKFIIIDYFPNKGVYLQGDNWVNICKPTNNVNRRILVMYYICIVIGGREHIRVNI